MKFYDFSIHGKFMKQEIQWNGNQVIRTLDREKSLFQNQQKSKPNLGKNEEQNDF